MKRDMELVRKILLQIEDSESYDVDEEGWRYNKPISLKLDKYEKATIDFHLEIMVERGLIILFSNKSVDPLRLTWEGYNLLDSIRDNE